MLANCEPALTNPQTQNALNCRQKTTKSVPISYRDSQPDLKLRKDKSSSQRLLKPSS